MFIESIYFAFNQPNWNSEIDFWLIRKFCIGSKTVKEKRWIFFPYSIKCLVKLHLLDLAILKKPPNNCCSNLFHIEHVGIRQSMDHMTIGSVILSIATILLSWLLAISCAFGVAYLLIKLEFINTWYSYPRFGIFLFGLPSLFGMLLGHYLGNIVIRKVRLLYFNFRGISSLLFFSVDFLWFSAFKFCVSHTTTN